MRSRVVLVLSGEKPFANGIDMHLIKVDSLYGPNDANVCY